MGRSWCGGWCQGGKPTTGCQLPTANYPPAVTGKGMQCPDIITYNTFPQAHQTRDRDATTHNIPSACRTLISLISHPFSPSPLLLSSPCLSFCPPASSSQLQPHYTPPNPTVLYAHQNRRHNITAPVRWAHSRGCSVVLRRVCCWEWGRDGEGRVKGEG